MQLLCSERELILELFGFTNSYFYFWLIRPFELRMQAMKNGSSRHNQNESSDSMESRV